MLCALAYVVMVFGRIPVLTVPPYLKYDPKDVIIVIGGFLYGPLAAFYITFVVAFFEMVTVSETAWIGATMNLVSSCAFACTAALIYKHQRSMKGAVMGLVAGWLSATAVMLLWNYLLTPIFLGYPRDVVAQMLIPVFLPFNLLKGGMNAAVTMLVYKPVRVALHRSRLLPVEESRVNNHSVIVHATDTSTSPAADIPTHHTAEVPEPYAAKIAKAHAGVIIVSLFVIITGVLFILAFQWII
jgi:riboflavin transporter FmnP